MSKKAKLIFKTAFKTYHERRIIGEGGSGIVYEVEDEIGETYASKCLVPEKMTNQKLLRFKNELYFCIRNEDENIIDILDYGVLTLKGRECPFYIMSYFPKTLRQLMKEGIKHERVLRFFSETINGVEAAHLQGVYHRDLKPENILYEPDFGNLVIADFGIAHFSEELIQEAVETKTLERLANFQYSAPEQRMRGREVDQRADIYALGVILNEMFTGELLQGTGYKKISEVAPEYSYLDDLVDTMVKQSPQDRPESIDVIKQELIGRKNAFVRQQKLSELKKQVVPTSQVDDPLINNPIKLGDVDYRDGSLVLILSQPPNRTWVEQFGSIHVRQHPYGIAPHSFTFRDNEAILPAEEPEVQKLVDYFKQWLLEANKNYEKKIIHAQRVEEEAQRRRLQEEIEEKEKRQRILKKIEI